MAYRPRKHASWKVHFAGARQMRNPGRSYSGVYVYATPCSRRGFIMDAVTSEPSLVTCKHCLRMLERNRRDGFAADYY